MRAAGSGKTRDLTKKKVYAGMTPEEALAAEKEHRRVLEVLTGLLIAQFVGMISNTIIGNAMPVIVEEIGGSSAQYTWIITSAILANTVMTPIAGKLADLFDKRKLFLLFMGIFMLGSLLAGLSVSPEMLIAVRVLQGIGMGGQVMMSIVIMATIIPPRQRGRYNGYQGAVMAAATVSGPFVGGLIVDIPWLGWRWCFFIAIPFMAIAGWVVARRLKLPDVPKKKVHIDVAGATLVAVSTCVLLLWVSFAGRAFPWVSWQSAAMVGGALALALLFVLVERRSPEPLIPLRILASRTTVLAVIASLSVGALMFGSNVFLGQYFQYGRSYSPTVAGLLGLPLMFGLLISSTWAGREVTRRGTWKGIVVAGMALMTAGVTAAIAIDRDTPLWYVSLCLFVAGWGLGMCMQNLLLAVQNTVGLKDMGAATSTVTFFRNLGGAVAIQVLGVVYTMEVARVSGGTVDSADTLDFAALPDGQEAVVRGAFGDAIWAVFAVCAVLSAVGLVAAIFMRPTSLRSTVDVEAVSKVLETSQDTGEPTTSEARMAAAAVGEAARVDGAGEPDDVGGVADDGGGDGAGAPDRAGDPDVASGPDRAGDEDGSRAPVSAPGPGPRVGPTPTR